MTTTLKLVPLNSDGTLEVIEFEHDGYQSLQTLVGGYIEFLDVSIDGHTYSLMFNEEGKLEALPPAIAMVHEGKVYDLVVGDAGEAYTNNDGIVSGVIHNADVIDVAGGYSGISA